MSIKKEKCQVFHLGVTSWMFRITQSVGRTFTNTLLYCLYYLKLSTADLCIICVLSSLNSSLCRLCLQRHIKTTLDFIGSWSMSPCSDTQLECRHSINEKMDNVLRFSNVCSIYPFPVSLCLFISQTNPDTQIKCIDKLLDFKETIKWITVISHFFIHCLSKEIT